MELQYNEVEYLITCKHRQNTVLIFLKLDTKCIYFWYNLIDVLFPIYMYLFIMSIILPIYGYYLDIGLMVAF